MEPPLAVGLIEAPDPWGCERKFRSYDVIEAEPEHNSVQLRVCSQDGGSFGDAYGISNLLSDDASVFSTAPGRAENVNIVLESKSPVPFTITSIVASVPFCGFTSPLSHAIVFTSHRYPSIPATSKWSVVKDEAEFTSLLHKHMEAESKQVAHSVLSASSESGSAGQMAKDSMEQEWEAPSPVAFLDMAAASRKTFHLTTPRSGRFILVKLLRSKYHFSDNIDTEFMGFRGLSHPMAFGSAEFAPVPPLRKHLPC